MDLFSSKKKACLKKAGWEIGTATDLLSHVSVQQRIKFIADDGREIDASEAAVACANNLLDDVCADFANPKVSICADMSLDMVWGKQTKLILVNISIDGQSLLLFSQNNVIAGNFELIQTQLLKELEHL